MSIDEIVEKTTIELPMSLSLKGAEKLLYYLAKELPANVSYQILHHKSIYRPFRESGRKILKQDGTIVISGSISNLEKPLAFDFFQLQASDKGRDDTSKLSVIKFNLVPGWELSEYRPEVIKLWDNVRVKVGQYFE